MKNKPALTGFLFLVIFSFDGKIFGQAKAETLIVADRMTNCTSAEMRKCPQIKHSAQNGNFAVLQNKIENSKYIPGYIYIRRTKSSTTKNLFAADWRLTKMDGKAIGANRAFLHFNEKESSFGGNGGCNGMGGNFSVKGSSIKFGQIISTKMFCRETQMDENAFLRNLEKVSRYEIRGDTLKLYAGKKAILEFAAKPE